MNILYLCAMEETAVKSKWSDNIWAALIFFTRLPFWRVYQPPQSSYKTVVEFWPLTGWLTGGAMAATLYFGSMVLPYAVAVIAAIAVRLLITGALHEDGLADFFDGFGGGSDRDRILAIMKDSHVGTYGVLGLIIYMLLLGAALYTMPVAVAALVIVAADPYSKMVTSQLVNMLPYARREEEAKNKTICQEQNHLSQALNFRWLEPDGTGSTADGVDDLADRYFLVRGHFHTRTGDVFLIPAHPAQD